MTGFPRFGAIRSASQRAILNLFPAVSDTACDKNAILRRLFSTFARGWPGAGLLLLRLVAGIALLGQTLMPLPSLHSVQSVIFPGFAIAVGVLLLLGLWTPIAGILSALLEVRNVFSNCDNPWIYILLGALDIALAMIGPGAWSVDARLFGWKRIGSQDR